MLYKSFVKMCISILGILILSTNFVNAATLTTTFAGGNAQDGNMFDVRAIAPVTITGFDQNFDGLGNSDIEIYSKSGTWVGSEDTPGDWTLLGSITVTSSGSGVGTPIPLVLNVPIAAGATTAFYITVTAASYANIKYTNGTAVGNVFATDGAIEILEGNSKGHPFASNNTPRVWNGTVTYTNGLVSPPSGTQAIPTLSEWALILLILTLGIVGFNISRRKSL